MAGPFPGMDPYIESQGNWQDLHNRLITEMCNSLGVRLPEDYVARVDESIEVVGFGENGGTAYRPDVLVARHDRPESGERSELAGSGLATIEPILNEVSDRDPEEIRQTWLEIRRLPELELVTVVEVLSPVNKAWPGRPSYLAKRDDLHARQDQPGGNRPLARRAAVADETAPQCRLLLRDRGARPEPADGGGLPLVRAGPAAANSDPAPRSGPRCSDQPE